jgi:cysteine desulfurase / selenocysteine lyase
MPDWQNIQREFPIFDRKIGGQRLIYLDNAATTQKPRAVIDAIYRYYCEENANVHRGIHALSQAASEGLDRARRRVQHFLGAAAPEEIVFTRGATEAINLVARSLGRAALSSGDEVLVTGMEHHSNLAPWQAVCAETGARLKVAPVTHEGRLDEAAFENLLTDHTRVAAMTHLSNVLGTVNPVRRLTALAHAAGAMVLIDGAQSAAHLAVDVQKIGCDFFVCSGHKMYGPTGIGVLYGRRKKLEALPPWQWGGGMVLTASLEESRPAPLPLKFEAGTPHTAGAYGLEAAIAWLENTGRDAIARREKTVYNHARETLGGIPGLRLLGDAPECTGVLSFVMDAAHPHDVAEVLNGRGIAVRAGHHCAQPVFQYFGVPAAVRASIGLYNTEEDINLLAQALREVNRIFG